LAVTSTRAALEKLMGSGTSAKSIIPRTEPATPAAEVLATMDAYFPLLLQLALSVQADPDAVRLCGSFVVEWPSPLTRLAVKVRSSRHVLSVPAKRHTVAEQKCRQVLPPKDKRRSKEAVSLLE
jgi:hypothetical protein